MSSRNSRGVTLTELMVATAIITIGVIASMGAFKFIAEAISNSRNRTIVTNLAQEKMEFLKNKPYYQLLVTTTTALSTGFSPNFAYDNSNYPPETFDQWGIALTRAVRVDYASVSGLTVSTVPFTNDDTGTKKITVYVYWTERGTPRKVQFESYYQNPSVAVLSTGFSGQVCRSPNNPPCTAANSVPSALVQVIGTPKWKSYADSSGVYAFQVSPGSYTLVASSVGYTSQATSMITAVSGVYTVSSFTLTAVASGTVSATSLYAYGTSLVVSQVVASSMQASSGFDMQYIELFNPTTAPINVTRTGCVPAPTCTDVSPNIQLNINSAAACSNPRDCRNAQLVYRSTYVAPGRYFLVANTASFTVLGVNYQPDAYFTDNAWGLQCPGVGSSGSPGAASWNPPTTKLIINYEELGSTAHNGTVWLTDSSGNTLDAVGWLHNNNDPGRCRGSCIPHNGGVHALLQGDQIVRFSTPCAAGNVYGRAYDTGNNANNFYYNAAATAVGIVYSPFTSASSSQTILSGRPSTGAYVYASDGNAGAVQSSISSVNGAQGQTCAYSSFTLTGVATGTWVVAAVANGFHQEVSNVVVTQGANTAITNAATSPAWPLANTNYVAMASTYAGGAALGYVYGSATAFTTRLNNISMLSSNGKTATTDSRGFYILYLPTGTVTISANVPSNGSHQSSDATVTINQGALTIVPDFHLAQGATIRGYVTSGTGALPGVAVKATNGASTFQDTTDNTGFFYIFVSTASTAWTVTPDLDPLSSYTSVAASPCTGSPITCTASTPGDTVFAGTITVTGSLGTITGTVSENGSVITTGVLVVASTGAVPDPLPSVYSSSSAASSVFYSASSQANGTYTVEVRNDSVNTYNMRAFYPSVNVNTGTVTYKTSTKSGVSVTAGATTPVQNFTTWP